MRGSSAENGSSIKRTSGSDASARAKADTLLHAAGQFTGKTILVTVQIDHGETALRDFPALRFGLAAHLQRKTDIVAHGAVRKEGHMLEHHADMHGAHGAELLTAKGQHIPPEHGNSARGRLDQAVQMAHHGRLAGAGKTHHAEDLAARHGEGAVGDADHAAEFFQDFGLGQPFVLDGLHRFTGALTKNFPDTFEFDDLIVGYVLIRHGGMSTSFSLTVVTWIDGMQSNRSQ